MIRLAPFVDYEPATVTVASIRESLAFLAAQDALRAVAAVSKVKSPVAPESTPLWGSQGPQARRKESRP